MKFKVGDKVKHKIYNKDFGAGEIIGFDVHDNQYAIEFENEHNDLMHNFSNTYKDAGLSNPIDRNAGYWCLDYEIELIEEVPKNLIPQIAKMLGVEMGERFKVNNVSGTFYFENYYLSEEGFNNFIFNNAQTRLNAILPELINGTWKIEKLPPKPKLTEDEKVILRNLPKEYKYIARDNSGTLYIYENKPKKDGNVWSNYNYNYLDLFHHLFQFIKWGDSEAYNIEELLKE